MRPTDGPRYRLPSPPAGVATGLRQLRERDRPAVGAHYLRLSREDRTQRFSSCKNDALLVRFADGMAIDGSLGLFLDDTLVGVAHLPSLPDDEVELGISIEPRARSCGWGRALLSASLEAMHVQGKAGLTAHYSAGNRPMARLLEPVAHRAQRHGPDVEARVDLDRWAADRHAATRLIEAEA